MELVNARGRFHVKINILKINKGGRSYEAEGWVGMTQREGLRWENKQGGTGFIFYQRHKRDVFEQSKKAVYISARRQEGTGKWMIWWRLKQEAMLDLLQPFVGVIIMHQDAMETHTHTPLPFCSEPKHALVGLSTVKVTQNKHALMWLTGDALCGKKAVA